MGLQPTPIESMNAATRLPLSILLAWSIAAWAQTAQTSQASAPQALAAAAAPQSTPQYTQAELEQMLAPIALYPDELLAQILMAATYPLEVVQAARWSRSHPDLVGDEAVARVDDEEWDPSVKALVAFPEVLALMDQKLDWTQRLGEAFLGEQSLAMDTVQRLRHAAYDKGNLRTTEEAVVQQQGGDIAIDPPTPDTVYVPYYDPRTVYGAWWNPDMPPVYWDPWPGYAIGPDYGLSWTLGIPVGAAFFIGAFDWHRHHVRVHDRAPFYDHGHHGRGAGRGHDTTAHGNEWHHDPAHRRGVPYRNVGLQRQFGGRSGAVDAARQYHGRPAAAVAGARPASGIARPSSLPSNPPGGYFTATPQAERSTRSSNRPGRGEREATQGTGPLPQMQRPAAESGIARSPGRAYVRPPAQVPAQPGAQPRSAMQPRSAPQYHPQPGLQRAPVPVQPRAAPQQLPPPQVQSAPSAQPQSAPRAQPAPRAGIARPEREAR
jgi:uncharacterized protein DUF3300